MTAAISFADESGIEALTLRALGRSLGASTTAVYRYFPDKNALLAAMRDSLLGQAIAVPSPPEDPREGLRVAARAFRRTALAHPCLGPLMATIALRGSETDQVPGMVGAALHALGLRGRELVIAHRQLESFVVGTSIFDMAGAPDHLTDRLDRLRGVDRPEFSHTLVNAAAVEEINEAAFEASLDALLSSVTITSRQAP